MGHEWDLCAQIGTKHASVEAIVNGITKGLSNITRGQIKRRIEAELKAIEANHAAPEDAQEESQPEDAKKPRPAKPQPSDVPR